VLGLRTGEILGCEFAESQPSGCGTAVSCNSCGTAKALLASLETNKPVQQKCAIVASRSGVRQDFLFEVRSAPLDLGKHRIVLLFLQDITQRQNWAAIESTFFHDIGNMLSSLQFASESLHAMATPEQQSMADQLLEISSRIVREFSIQRSLVHSGAPNYKVHRVTIQASRVLEELSGFFRNNPASVDLFLNVMELEADFAFVTDHSLLLRVLHNMLTNAIEASRAGQTVRLVCMQEEDGVFFSVWNQQAIPAEYQKRIFQRNFTTKSEDGHGLGTFSMKLFGESILGGKVTYTTSEEEGTTFELFLPQ
jgi:signal transduction histidine kinase